MVRTKNASVKRKRTDDESPSKFHSNFFTNLVDSRNFKEDFFPRDLCPTFVLDLKWFRSQEGFDFIGLLEKHKLMEFLTMRGTVAPNYVKAFYTTLTYDFKSETLSAEIKGTKINISLARLSEISHLPYDGERLVQKGFKENSASITFPDSWTTFKYQEACDSFCHPDADRAAKTLSANSLSTKMRLLHYAVSKTILPKAHNRATVNYEESLVLWGIKNEKKINWAQLVVGYMLKCKASKERDLPYGVLITKLLRQSDIPFVNEIMTKEKDACHDFGSRAIGQMRLEFVGGVWQNKIVGPVSALEYDPNAPQTNHASSDQNTPLEAPASSSSQASLDQIVAILNTIKEMVESNQKEIITSREIHSKELANLTDRVMTLEKRLETSQPSSSNL